MVGISSVPLTSNSGRTPPPSRTGRSLRRIEYGCQAIRNSRHAAVRFPVGIIDLLDATTARDVVLTHCDFQSPIHKAGHEVDLHQAPYHNERWPTNTARSISCNDRRIRSRRRRPYLPLIRTSHRHYRIRSAPWRFGTYGPTGLTLPLVDSTSLPFGTNIPTIWAAPSSTTAAVTRANPGPMT